MAVCLATARCSRLLLIGESRSNRYLLAGFRTRLASSVQHHSLPRLQSRHYLSYLSLSVLVTKVHISQQLHKPQHIQQCTASSSPTVKHFSSLKMANTTASNGHCNEDSSSSVTHKITEMQIPVPWGGHLAAKIWGEPNDHPILALHGWQDNAGTWDRLIPLLPSNFYIVCLDFCGHGLSSHYPSGLLYHYWDHIAHIRLVAAHFNWSRFSILGHSMGGIVGSTFAAVSPLMVDKLVMVDIIKPISTPAKAQPDKSAKAIDTYMEVLKKLEQPPPSYPYEIARDRLVAANNGSIDRVGAEVLMRRGTKQRQDGNYTFSRDLRLVIPSVASYTVEQHAEYAKRVHCPLLLIKGKQGTVYEDKAINEEFVKIYRAACGGAFQYVEVDGTHHVHLVNPENVAPLITKFLSIE